MHTHQVLKAGLTPAQERVARKIAEGLSTKEIGNVLRIAPRTVDAHTYLIRKTLGIRGKRSGLSILLRRMFYPTDRPVVFRRDHLTGDFTRSEERVLTLLAQGLETHEIISRLGIGREWIYRLKCRIRKIADLRGASERLVAIYAFERAIINRPEPDTQMEKKEYAGKKHYRDY